MSRRAAAGIARRDEVPRRLRSPGQGSANRDRSSGLGRKPAAARRESRALGAAPRPRTGGSRASCASALASDPRISFEPGISGNLPGRRFDAGKESPGWTLPADLPDREGAREASMREAGKPFPGRIGIEPRTLCGRVESRRQNGMRPRRPGGNEGRQKAIPEIHPRERGSRRQASGGFVRFRGKARSQAELCPGGRRFRGPLEKSGGPPEEGGRLRIRRSGI
jgi:hypothetical protein